MHVILRLSTWRLGCLPLQIFRTVLGRFFKRFSGYVYNSVQFLTLATPFYSSKLQIPLGALPHSC